MFEIQAKFFVFLGGFFSEIMLVVRIKAIETGII